MIFNTAPISLMTVSSMANGNTQSHSPPAKKSIQVTRSTLHPGLHKYPAFYACYLLRSYQNGKPNQRTYVGSTPDPPRRIRQHNGQLKGGAARTKYYRPWEMELICYGFPSKLVALQFEWAWNTPYKSRHLQISQPVNNDDPNQTKLNQDGSIAGKADVATVRKRPMFPRSMGNRVEVKLKVLRKMMTCLPWAQYPLKVLFFEQRAYQLWMEQAKPPESWNKNTAKVNKPCPKEDSSVLHPYPIQVELRLEGVDGMRKSRCGLPISDYDQSKPIEVHDQEAILEDYEKIEAFKTRSNGNWKCNACEQPVDIDAHLLYVTCQAPDCFMIAHIGCLAKHFLNTLPAGEKDPLSPSSESVDESSNLIPRVLPDRGHCLVCSIDLRWGELIKSCYRRMPRHLTKAQISASDDEEDPLDDNQHLDSNLYLGCSSTEELDGATYHGSTSRQTKKKPTSSHESLPSKNQPKSRVTNHKKVTKDSSRTKKTTQKRIPVQQEEEEDEPEQDFVKMMDELQVSD